MTRTPVIPAPARLTPAAGEFRLVSGTAIGVRDPVLTPLAARFARDVRRRTGIALELATNDPAAAIVVDLGDDAGLARHTRLWDQDGLTYFRAT